MKKVFILLAHPFGFTVLLYVGGGHPLLLSMAYGLIAGLTVAGLMLIADAIERVAQALETDRPKAAVTHPGYDH